MMITREWLTHQLVCPYTEDEVAGLVPPEGLTLLEALNSPIPDTDKVWLGTRALPVGAVATFAKACAKRVRDYADVDASFGWAARAADEYAKAVEAAEAADENVADHAAAWAAHEACGAALFAAAYARDCTHYDERAKQIQHLRELASC